MECGSAKNLPHEVYKAASVCRNVKDVDTLLSSIISLGEGIIGSIGTDIHTIGINFIFTVRRLFDRVSIHII